MNRDELIQALSDAESTELALLAQAVENTKQAVFDKASKPNLEAFALAKKMCDGFLAQKAGDEAAQDPGQTFRKKSDVLRWLKDQGYQVEKSKFYQDCKKDLLLKQNGAFAEKDVLDYAAKAELERVEVREPGSDGEFEKYLLRTKRSKAEESELIVDRLRIKLALEKGLAISIDDYNQDFASAAMVLRDSMFQFFEMRAKEIIFLSKGDPNQELAVQEFLKAQGRTWLHGFSRKKTFEVATDADG